MLETERLLIVPCDRELLLAAIQGNAVLENYMCVHVPDNWTEFGALALQYAADRLTDPEELGWWTYLPILKAENKLIGSGGYKGKPDEYGRVEIGYEIAAEYRNQGLATEYATALIKNAFSDQEVLAVVAHTLGEDNTSTKVLTKCGFVKVEEIDDSEDGLIWKWELERF